MSSDFTTEVLSDIPVGPGIVNLKIGTAKFPIWPSKPDAPSTEAAPWRFPHPFIPEPTDKPVYDPVTKRIRMTFIASDPLDSRAQAARNLEEFYQSRGETIEITPGLLQVLPYSRCEVYIHTNDGRTILVKEHEAPGGGAYARSIPVIWKVPEDEIDLLEILKETPEYVSIILRFYYTSILYSVTKVSVTMLQSSTQQAQEEIFGKAGIILTNRNGLQKFKEELNRRFTIRRSGRDETGQTSKLLSKLLEIAGAHFDSLTPLGIDELTSISSSCFIWTPDNARKEIEPRRFSHLTTSLRTADRFQHNWETAWDNLKTVANESDNYTSFHRKLREHVSTDGEHGSSASFLDIFSGSTDMKFHLDTDTESLSDEKKRDINKTFSLLKKEGNEKEFLMREAFLDWTGNDFESGFEAKTLAVFRINDIAFIQKLVGIAMDVEESSKEDISREWVYRLGEQALKYVEPPAGTVAAFAGTGDKVPFGWLLCDGSPYDTQERPELKELYQTIGTDYGNTAGHDGWFNVPDYRGLFLRGVDDPDGPQGKNAANRDVDSDMRKSHTDWETTVKGIVGSVQNYTTAPPKNNFWANLKHTHGYGRAVAGYPRAGGTEPPLNTEGRATSDPALSDKQNTSEGGGDEETRPKNVYVNWIIKY